MVLVNVIRRFINIIPMQKSITQFDESAVTYRFQIDRIYENFDLGENGWEWTIAWKNSLDRPNAIMVTPEVDTEKVYLEWTPRWPETASAGMFEFQIRAKKDNLNTGELLKWNTQTAHLDFNTSMDLGHMDRGILEDYLDKFMQLCSTATIDAEQQRALAAELALSQSIDDTAMRLEIQIDAVSRAVDSLAGRLDNFDTQEISNYVPAQEDAGEILATDSLDVALAKLQWQINHTVVSGILPVDHGGTGAGSFNPGVLISNGNTLPLNTITGNTREVLTTANGRPKFRQLSTEDLTDHSEILRFTPLQDTTIDISRFME